MSPRDTDPALAVSDDQQGVTVAVPRGRLAGPDTWHSVSRPIQERKVADNVVLIISDAIRSGIYKPGMRLPRVRDLAAVLGVSTAVIREAVEILRRAEVVSVKRGRSGGIFVESTANLSQVLRSVQGQTHASILAVLQARRPLEIAAAALVAERRDPETLAHLRGLVRQLEATNDPDEFVRVDATFHYALGARSGNEVLAAALTPVLDRCLAATLAEVPSGRVDREQGMANQITTIEALETGSREAAVKALDEHLAALENAMLGRKLPFP